MANWLGRVDCGEIGNWQAAQVLFFSFLSPSPSIFRLGENREGRKLGHETLA